MFALPCRVTHGVFSGWCKGVFAVTYRVTHGVFSGWCKGVFALPYRVTHGVFSGWWKGGICLAKDLFALVHSVLPLTPTHVKPF